MEGCAMNNSYQSITEGEIWNYAYELNNYKVQYTSYNCSKNKCAIYFSSSGIYYPNTEEQLYKSTHAM